MKDNKKYFDITIKDEKGKTVFAKKVDMIAGIVHELGTDIGETTSIRVGACNNMTIFSVYQSLKELIKDMETPDMMLMDMLFNGKEKEDKEEESLDDTLKEIFRRLTKKKE